MTYAAVLLAEAATADDSMRLDAMMHAASAAGADPVVMVTTRGVPASTGARGTAVAPGAPAISAIRAGMALLANSAVRHALLWRFDARADAVPVATLRALADAASRSTSVVTALDGAALDQTPVMIARDAWLELMTLGEQGLDALATSRGVQRVPII